MTLEPCWPKASSVSGCGVQISKWFAIQIHASGMFRGGEFTGEEAALGVVALANREIITPWYKLVE